MEYLPNGSKNDFIFSYVKYLNSYRDYIECNFQNHGELMHRFDAAFADYIELLKENGLSHDNCMNASLIYAAMLSSQKKLRVVKSVFPFNIWEKHSSKDSNLWLGEGTM